MTDTGAHDEAYRRYRHQIAERIGVLIRIEHDAEQAFALFVSADIASVMRRNRKLITQARAMWRDDAFDRALLHCNQIEGGLIELRGMLRDLGVMPATCDHMLDALYVEQAA